MTDRSIAFRRAKLKNKKLKTERILKRNRAYDPDKALIGIYTHSPARCSCNMCGNARKYYGESLKEKAFAEIDHLQDV